MKRLIVGFLKGLLIFLAVSFFVLLGYIVVRLAVATDMIMLFLLYLLIGALIVSIYSIAKWTPDIKA